MFYIVLIDSDNIGDLASGTKKDLYQMVQKMIQICHKLNQKYRIDLYLSSVFSEFDSKKINRSRN